MWSWWVESVTSFSSEYDDSDYYSSQVIGPPNVYPDFDDTSSAWTPEDYGLDRIEHLELRFRNSVIVSSVNLYETYGPGRIIKIQLLDPSGTWDIVWQGDAQDQSSFDAARIFSPPMESRAYMLGQGVTSSGTPVGCRTTHDARTGT